MNSLNDYNFQGKRVLVRCDFNVPIENHEVLDDFKIQSCLETLFFLKRAGAKIILLSHLGRPGKISNFQFPISKFSLKPVALKLQELLKDKVQFVNQCLGRKAKRAVNKMQAGDILLLENLRFHQGEEDNDENFSRALADFGDVYVNEAFSVCHRRHSSVNGLPNILPHFAGITLQKEIEALSRVSDNFEKPLAIIIGGVKITSKIKVIEKFLQIADHLLLGGKIANTILRIKGICIGLPWPEAEVVEKVERLNLTSQKLHLPVDVLVSPDRTGDIYVRETAPGSVRKDEDIFDIGKETIESFCEIIRTAKTIFWSGPLGLAENEKFSKGTREIGEHITHNYNAFKVVGGGDTVAILRKFGFLSQFSHASTGGGAMLAFLTGEKLPGIEALR